MSAQPPQAVDASEALATAAMASLIFNLTLAQMNAASFNQAANVALLAIAAGGGKCGPAAGSSLSAVLDQLVGGLNGQVPSVPGTGDPASESPRDLGGLQALCVGNMVNNLNLAQQNALANQQAINEVARAVTGKVVNHVLDAGLPQGGTGDGAASPSGKRPVPA